MTFNFKNIISSSFVVCLCLILFIADTKCKRGEFERLRSKALTVHTEGVITKISKSRKGQMLVYSYTFNVNSKAYSNIFQMKKKYDGIVEGSPVGVVYLKENPNESRLVFTKDDLNWID